MALRMELGSTGDILTEGTVLLCCWGMLGKGSESTTNSCDKRGQEKPCLTKVMRFSLKPGEFEQRECRSETTHLGLSVCVA